MDKISIRIQVLSIVIAVAFMLFIFRLIARGKLREEYSIVWIFCTAILLLFSIWRDGLDVIARLLGIVYAPSLIFLAALFAIVVFLVHLSVVNSRQHKQIRDLTQEMALMKEKLADKTEAPKS